MTHKVESLTLESKSKILIMMQCKIWLDVNYEGTLLAQASQRAFRFELWVWAFSEKINSISLVLKSDLCQLWFLIFFGRLVHCICNIAFDFLGPFSRLGFWFLLLRLILQVFRFGMLWFRYVSDCLLEILIYIVVRRRRTARLQTPVSNQVLIRMISWVSFLMWPIKVISAAWSGDYNFRKIITVVTLVLFKQVSELFQLSYFAIEFSLSFSWRYVTTRHCPSTIFNGYGQGDFFVQ